MLLPPASTGFGGAAQGIDQADGGVVQPGMAVGNMLNLLGQRAFILFAFGFHLVDLLLEFIQRLLHRANHGFHAGLALFLLRLQYFIGALQELAGRRVQQPIHQDLKIFLNLPPDIA